jgi:lysozyme
MSINNLQPSIGFYDLVENSEGFSEKPYVDKISKTKVPTIGFGFTKYPSGLPVTMNDRAITKAKAREILKDLSGSFTKELNNVLKVKVSQNQFDALLDFAYNLGISKLQTSTLLEKVNKNPNDPTIKDEFNKWIYSGGLVRQGLVLRRAAEAKLYFT